jgi:hypothetical protein
VTTPPPWTDDDSAALDQQVRALRQAERRERGKGSSPVTGTEARQALAAGTRYVTTFPSPINGGRKRPGFNTEPPPAPLYPALLVPGQSTAQPNQPPESPPRKGRQSKPRQRPNGRWVGVVNIDKRRYGKTFDTEHEAQDFIDKIKERND